MKTIRSVTHYALAGALQVVLALAVLSCIAPLPPTPGPTPVPSPDAAGDIFTRATIDCAIQAPNPPVDEVRTCADMTNTASCMADLVGGTRTVDVVGCTARDMAMDLHVRMAKGIASDATKAEAAALDGWFREHNISVRN